LILGIVGGSIGVAVAIRRNGEPRQRVVGGILAVIGMLAVFFARSCSSDSVTHRYEAAIHRQGYALGFGLGQHLKQTQPGRRLLILRTKPDQARDPEIIHGLRDGLAERLVIVGERTLDTAGTMELGDVAARLTPEFLTELKATGADIVVSFAGLPYRVRRDGGYTAIDTDATLALWQSPEYRALQWVLPQAPELEPPGLFREGRVLAVIREKPQQVTTGGFPAYLEIEGTPAALFDAWFEILTAE
jgi:hypothetical protein